MIYAENKIGLAVRRAFAVFAAGLAGGEFVSAQRVLRTEIARANTVSAAENARSLFGLQRRNRAAEFHGLVRLAQRHTDVARERVVAREAFVGAFENDDVLL